MIRLKKAFLVLLAIFMIFPLSVIFAYAEDYPKEEPESISIEQRIILEPNQSSTSVSIPVSGIIFGKPKPLPPEPPGDGGGDNDGESALTLVPPTKKNKVNAFTGEVFDFVLILSFFGLVTSFVLLVKSLKLKR